MELTMDLFEPGLVDVRVNLRGRKAGVAQHFLDRAQVGPVAEEMRGKGVAQKMGQIFLCKPASFAICCTICQTRAVVNRRPCSPRKISPPVLGLTKSGLPFASQSSSAVMAFSPTGTTRSRFPFPITRRSFSSQEILQAQPDEFARAQPAGVEDFHQGAVAQTERRLRQLHGKQAIHVGLAQHLGQQPSSRGRSSAERRSCPMMFSRLRWAKKWRRATTMIFIEEGASRFSVRCARR